MAEQPFQGWLEKAANYSCVLACGVYIGPQSMAVKSFSESFPEPQIKELLQRVAEIALGLRVYQLGSSRLRWVFENGQFHVAKRPDGVMAVLAVNQDPDAAAAIEELLANFSAIVAAPEKTTFRLPEPTESGGQAASGHVQ
jgi:uncharacterized membrane protein